jgi:4-hydroxybutyrate CoA-transferase
MIKIRVKFNLNETILSLRSLLICLLAAGVVTLRSDVEWVATEYGLCNLKGKCLRQRAKCLIQIAHPNCRDMLEAEARKRFHFL